MYSHCFPHQSYCGTHLTRIKTEAVAKYCISAPSPRLLAHQHNLNLSFGRVWRVSLSPADRHVHDDADSIPARPPQTTPPQRSCWTHRSSPKRPSAPGLCRCFHTTVWMKTKKTEVGGGGGVLMKAKPNIEARQAGSPEGTIIWLSDWLIMQVVY